jgi:hypothetical protein
MRRDISKTNLFFNISIVWHHLQCGESNLLGSPGIVAVVADESGTNAKSGCPSRVDQSSCVFIFHGAIN